jgi:hypothetical protein
MRLPDGAPTREGGLCVVVRPGRVEIRKVAAMAWDNAAVWRSVPTASQSPQAFLVADAPPRAFLAADAPSRAFLVADTSQRTFLVADAPSRALLDAEAWDR